MRKIVSIPLLILILFTGITVHLAAHYCGGEYIESKVSFSGKLATCGMEHSHNEKPGFNESDHSCEDLTSAYTLSGNYFPAPLQVIDDIQQYQSACCALNILFSREPHVKVLNTIIRPPGNYLKGIPAPEIICVFRI